MMGLLVLPETELARYSVLPGGPLISGSSMRLHQTPNLYWLQDPKLLSLQNHENKFSIFKNYSVSDI